MSPHTVTWPGGGGQGPEKGGVRGGVLCNAVHLIPAHTPLKAISYPPPPPLPQSPIFAPLIVQTAVRRRSSFPDGVTRLDPSSRVHHKRALRITGNGCLRLLLQRIWGYGRWGALGSGTPQKRERIREKAILSATVCSLVWGGGGGGGIFPKVHVVLHPRGPLPSCFLDWWLCCGAFVHA